MAQNYATIVRMNFTNSLGNQELAEAIDIPLGNSTLTYITAWNTGRNIVHEKLRSNEMTLKFFVDKIKVSDIESVVGEDVSCLTLDGSVAIVLTNVRYSNEGSYKSDMMLYEAKFIYGKTKSL